MIFRVLNYVDRLIARCEWLIMLAALAVTVLVLMAQVLLHYGVAAPFFWAEEVAMILMIVMTFTGLSLLARSRRLVAVDLLGRYLGGGIACFLRRCVGLVVLAVALAVAWYAAHTALAPTASVEWSPTLGMPQAVFHAVFAAETVFLAYHQIVALIADVLRRQPQDHD
jgi:TRAP-type C4-dicarboxylate transport system permease small subunit